MARRREQEADRARVMCACIGCNLVLGSMRTYELDCFRERGSWGVTMLCQLGDEMLYSKRFQEPGKTKK